MFEIRKISIYETFWPLPKSFLNRDFTVLSNYECAKKRKSRAGGRPANLWEYVVLGESEVASRNMVG